MKVYYEKPCFTFQQIIGLPVESINSFMQWCEKSFVKDFVEPLDRFCATHDNSKPFPLNRKKRIAPLVIVGVVSLFVTAFTGIGLGSTAVYKSGKNEERISTLEANINRINENQRFMKEALEFMQSDIEKIGSILENNTSELENLKRILPDIVSTTSYLSSEFVQTRTSLLEIGRDWIRGRINGKLFDQFNVSIPCEGPCPLQHMFPRTCLRDPLRKTIFFIIEAPIIDNKKQLLIADPFILYSYENNELCQMDYRGPINIIYDNETHSLCPFEVRNLRVQDLILNPTKESCSWYTPLKSDEAWQVHQCFAKSKLRENEVVQIKYDLSSRSLLVFCYPFNITLIQGNFISDSVACPDYVFSVPINSTLKIGNLSFISHNLKFDSRYNLVPEWLRLINQRLLPDLHSHKIALHHDEIKSRIRKNKYRSNSE
jgi:hypothetical protein